jgi:hypothetical protein
MADLENEPPSSSAVDIQKDSNSNTTTLDETKQTSFVGRFTSLQLHLYNGTQFVTSPHCTPSTLYRLRLFLAIYMIVTGPLHFLDANNQPFAINKMYWFYFSYFTNLSW